MFLMGLPHLSLFLPPKTDNEILRAMNIASANCDIQNMLNAATTLGLGGCYKALAMIGFNQGNVKQMVGIAETDDVIGTITVGYPADDSPHEPRPLATNIRYCR